MYKTADSAATEQTGGRRRCRTCRDGCRTFGRAASYIGLYAESRRERNFTSYVETYKGTCKSILDNPQSTPFTFIFADGRKFVTRDHLFPYDDVFASWIL